MFFNGVLIFCLFIVVGFLFSGIFNGRGQVVCFGNATFAFDESSPGQKDAYANIVGKHKSFANFLVTKIINTSSTAEMQQQMQQQQQQSLLRGMGAVGAGSAESRPEQLFSLSSDSGAHEAAAAAAAAVAAAAGSGSGMRSGLRTDGRLLSLSSDGDLSHMGAAGSGVHGGGISPFSTRRKSAAAVVTAKEKASLQRSERKEQQGGSDSGGESEGEEDSDSDCNSSDSDSDSDTESECSSLLGGEVRGLISGGGGGSSRREGSVGRVGQSGAQRRKHRDSLDLDNSSDDSQGDDEDEDVRVLDDNDEEDYQFTFDAETKEMSPPPSTFTSTKKDGSKKKKSSKKGKKRGKKSSKASSSKSGKLPTGISNKDEVSSVAGALAPLQLPASKSTAPLPLSLLSTDAAVSAPPVPPRPSSLSATQGQFDHTYNSGGGDTRNSGYNSGDSYSAPYPTRHGNANSFATQRHLQNQNRGQERGWARDSSGSVTANRGMVSRMSSSSFFLADIDGIDSPRRAAAAAAAAVQNNSQYGTVLQVFNVAYEVEVRLLHAYSVGPLSRSAEELSAATCTAHTPMPMRMLSSSSSSSSTATAAAAAGGGAGLGTPAAATSKQQQPLNAGRSQLSPKNSSSSSSSSSSSTAAATFASTHPPAPHAANHNNSSSSSGGGSYGGVRPLTKNEAVERARACRQNAAVAQVIVPEDVGLCQFWSLFAVVLEMVTITDTGCLIDWSNCALGSALLLRLYKYMCELKDLQTFATAICLMGGADILADLLDPVLFGPSSVGASGGSLLQVGASSESKKVGPGAKVSSSSSASGGINSSGHSHDSAALRVHLSAILYDYNDVLNRWGEQLAAVEVSSLLFNIIPEFNIDRFLIFFPFICV
jgi:hypothetical protein